MIRLRDASKSTLVALTCALVFTVPASAETVVTHYIVKTQEERKSTRWTLTEWLHIKERMKMMDLWLAMFSNPDKDKFRPELNLSYNMTRGKMTSTLGESTDQASEISGTQATAQLWLTNPISASTGLRTLNIDLGVEGRLHRSGAFAPSTPPDPAPEVASTYANKVVTGNLRIFGGNVQDTSLLLKYGRYELEHNLGSWRPEDASLSAKGLTAGGEMVLYLLGGLGAEGRYQVFGSADNYKGDDTIKGAYHDYQAFIEISLLRITFGKFAETWEGTTATDDPTVTPNTVKSTYDGYIAGLKLLF